MKKILFLILAIVSNSCFITGSVNEGGDDSVNSTPAPTISSVTAPSDGNRTSSASPDLDFTVTFDQAVTVTGTPRLTLTVGSETRYATYQSGTGTTALVFRYSVVSTDLDIDGISMSSTLDLNGGNIANSEGDTTELTFTVPTLTGITATYTGLELWIDAQDASTIFDDSNDNPGDAGFSNLVASWTDKSGNSNDFSQGTSSSQPTYESSGDIDSSLPAISFEASNDYMTSSYDVNTDSTILFVFAHDQTGSSTPTGPVWQTNADASTNGFFPAWSDGKQYLAYVTSWLNKTTTFTRNDPYVISVQYNTTGTQTVLRSNGASNHSGSFNPPTHNNFQLGKRNSDYYRGDLAELLIFNRVLDDSGGGELETLENALSAKWGSIY